MHIRRATPADIPAIADAAAAAMRESPFSAFFCPYTPARARAHRGHFLRKAKISMVTPGHVQFVAVLDAEDVGFDGEERVMGYAHYVRMGEDEAGRRWMGDDWGKRLDRTLLTLESLYLHTFHLSPVDYTRYALVASESARLRTLAGVAPTAGHWDLNLLAVAPGFQRRGVGGALVDVGVELARDEGVPITLEATEEGEGLYLKKGFVEVGRLELGEEGLRPPALVWWPR